MASVNRVTLIGRVGQTPEIVTFSNGDKIAKLSIATGRKWRDRDGGDHEDTQWHNIIVGGKAADVVEQYIDKGQQVFVEGEIRYRSYDDKAGNKRSITEIHAVNIQMLGGKPQGDQQPQQNQHVQQEKGRPESKPVEAYDSNDGSDDLPF